MTMVNITMVNIPIHLFINTLFCQIRGETINFSKHESWLKREQESTIINQITNLKKRIDVNLGDNTSNKNQLEKLNNELLEIRSNKLKGHQIRSRYQHYKDWEKPSKFFLNLEKKNYLNKNIFELITNNNQIINDSKSILKEQASFYRDLFSTKGNKIDKQTRYSHLLDNLPKITATTKHKLEESIKLIELEDSIKTSKTNKAPGPDGFSNEVFSHELKYCEDNDIPGMLVIIDYAKAFDTIKWDFITHCLKNFGYGSFIIKTIKLLQHNSYSRVEQNGHLSEKIHLSRGHRQGDPISPYLFVICAELLSHVMGRNHSNTGWRYIKYFNDTLCNGTITSYIK